MAKPQVKKSLEMFNQELAEVHMTGQWIYEDLLNRAVGGPRPRGDAYLWPWPMVHEKLLEACNVLEESFTARRSVLFGNPGLNDNATTHTLLMGVQMIKPGEIAWAHRHTLAAVRFVIKGDGKVFTVVDGEKCPMERYDLILTPQWTWHDHRNPTTESAIWVDALDVPFLLGLNQPFYEPYPGNKVQTLREKSGEHLQQRAGAVRSTWENTKKENVPLRYAWKDIEPQLRALMDQPGSPYDGVALEGRARRWLATRRWNGRSMIASRFPTGRGTSISTGRRAKRRFYFPSTTFRSSRLSACIEKSRRIRCTRRKCRRCRR